MLMIRIDYERQSENHLKNAEKIEEQILQSKQANKTCILEQKHA